MIVALTGVILILFVIGHLLATSRSFSDPIGYSQHFRNLGPLLWLIRIFLLITVVVHIYVTIRLAIDNRRARPNSYIDKENVKATFASRHMVMSGLIVFMFIIYHLAHSTFHKTDLRFALLKLDPLNHYDVYSMMVYGFQNYLVSAFYVLGLFLLALHLSHGSSRTMSTTTLENLPVKIFADGADLEGIIDLSRKPFTFIKGLTTNPALMHKVGITNYETFARSVLESVTDKPISFEVFSDEFQEMRCQAL